MQIQYSRAMLHAALDGQLDKVKYVADPVFGLQVPEKCSGVADGVMIPRHAWKDSDAYDATAKKLAGMFVERFKKYESLVSDEVKVAGPEPQPPNRTTWATPGWRSGTRWRAVPAAA